MRQRLLAIDYRTDETDVADVHTGAHRSWNPIRFDPEALFSQARRCVETALPESAPFLAAVDDSILRKSGTRIPGVACRRDPLDQNFRRACLVDLDEQVHEHPLRRRRVHRRLLGRVPARRIRLIASGGKP